MRVHERSNRDTRKFFKQGSSLYERVYDWPAPANRFKCSCRLTELNINLLSSFILTRTVIVLLLCLQVYRSSYKQSGSRRMPQTLSRTRDALAVRCRVSSDLQNDAFERIGSWREQPTQKIVTQSRAFCFLFSCSVTRSY